jgi:DNA-binding LytR/AlgR family response regulator
LQAGRIFTENFRSLKDALQLLFHQKMDVRQLLLPEFLVKCQPLDIFCIKPATTTHKSHLTSGKKEIMSMQLGQIEKAIPPSHFFRISRSTIINLTHFTHADQKLKKCFLEFDGEEFDFPIRVSKIRELQGVMVGE